jgi:hypothetical protein
MLLCVNNNNNTKKLIKFSPVQVKNKLHDGVQFVLLFLDSVQSRRFRIWRKVALLERSEEATDYIVVIF